MGEMSKKDLKDLMEEMRNMVQKAFGDDFYVSLETVKKNNGLTKNAVNIRQSDEPIASVIYIDQVLGLIKDGSTGLQDAVNEIVEMYEKQSTEITMNGAAGIMESLKKENILKKVVYRLINREKNREKLAYVPHRDFLDLAVVYCMEENKAGGLQYSVMLDDALCYSLGISLAELEEASEQNTQARGFTVQTMDDIIRQSVSEDMGATPSETLGVSMRVPARPDMWVFTSISKAYGAPILLYQKYFEDVAVGLNDDLYIMPSSIHELICIPAAGVNPGDLRTIVREINSTQVAAEDVLSNNVYLYRKETGVISIAPAK